jgi:hypothetical protein
VNSTPSPKSETDWIALGDGNEPKKLDVMINNSSSQNDSPFTFYHHSSVFSSFTSILPLSSFHKAVI